MKIILEGTPNELADLIAGVWQRTYDDKQKDDAAEEICALRIKADTLI